MCSQVTKSSLKSAYYHNPTLKIIYQTFFIVITNGARFLQVGATFFVTATLGQRLLQIRVKLLQIGTAITNRVIVTNRCTTSFARI